MTIAIFAPRDAAFARRLAERAQALSDAPVHFFAVEPEPTTPAAVNGAELTWGGARLDQASAAFVTGFRYEDPVLPPPSGEADWSFWQSRHVLRQQSYSFCWSFFSRLEAAGVKMHNPPSALLNLFCRQRPLDVLRAAGLPAASVTLTNDPAVAEDVQNRAGENQGGVAVWRPAAGRAAWQAFRDKQRRHLVGPDKPPILLAAAVGGAVFRIYVFEGEIVLALTAAPPAREAVERFERCAAVDPQTIPGAKSVVSAAATLNLNWAVFTVVADDAGLTIYDVDPDPVVADLPQSFRAHLVESLARGLAGSPLPAPLIDVQEARDTLLLRRMLVIQFEMEATKHAPA